MSELSQKYGQESELTVHCGKVHDYLGMVIDYSTPGQVSFSMPEYVDKLIKETPSEMLGRTVQTPATLHLFKINNDAVKLSSEDAVLYHHLMAKILHLCKRTRPNLQLAVAFLTTQVKCPDADNYKKLGRCLTYIRDTRDMKLTLAANNMSQINWWVDASFAVHPKCRSHTGATMTLGKGAVYSMSTKQKINTRSSTEAELVAINNAMSMILWVRNFLIAQGYQITDNVIMQDNQSTILLAENGRQSSGKKTCHIEI